MSEYRDVGIMRCRNIEMSPKYASQSMNHQDKPVHTLEAFISPKGTPTLYTHSFASHKTGGIISTSCKSLEAPINNTNKSIRQRYIQYKMSQYKNELVARHHTVYM
jgi:hypothetical protein